MTNESKRLIAIGAIVFVLAIGAGTGLARWRASRQQQSQPVAEAAAPTPLPLPQFGSLLTASDNGEVQGKALCGYCSWEVGAPEHNVVLKTDAAPGLVFLSPNEQLTEIEKLTGKCADGTIEIRARGAVTQYAGRNYLLVRNFETVPSR